VNRPADASEPPKGCMHDAAIAVVARTGLLECFPRYWSMTDPASSSCPCRRFNARRGGGKDPGKKHTD
jgi:hypothetical protein